jgi:putative transposase
MARSLRVEYAGAVYHVMCRGNNGQAIFLSDKDRTCFLRTLEESCDQAGWKVHAYVLMGNHYHLLLETPEPNLVAGMKWLQGTYTQRFNSANKCRGHLFQGRYKSLILDPSEADYFSTVSTYIHLNPIRAVLCEHPDQFPWSSCRYYTDARLKKPKWLMSRRVCHSLGFPAAALKQYKAYIRKRAGEERDPAFDEQLAMDRSALRRGWIMGNEKFRNQMLDLMKERKGGGDNLRGEQRKMHGEHQAEQYIKKALDILRVEESELLAMKSTQPTKQAIAWLLKKHTVVTAVWIAGRLSMGHRVNASRSISSFDALTDPESIELKDKMLQCTG